MKAIKKKQKHKVTAKGWFMFCPVWYVKGWEDESQPVTTLPRHSFMWILLDLAGACWGIKSWAANWLSLAIWNRPYRCDFTFRIQKLNKPIVVEMHTMDCEVMHSGGSK